jgi:hypothetical protein
MGAKQKIIIVKATSKMYWYADKVGEQFEVDFINDDGNYLVNNIGIVKKADAEIVITDTIVDSVISQFKKRSRAGYYKYGTTLDRNDLSTLEWISHAQEEAMDFCLYLEKLKTQIKNGKTD